MNVTIDYFPSRSGCDDLQSGDSAEDNDSIVFPLILVNLLIVDDFLETFQRFKLQFWVF